MTYKRASFSLLGGITALLCFFAIVLSTPWGAQLSLYTVNSFSPLQVEYKSGTLLNDLVLRQLIIENEEIVIDVKNIRVKLHLRCLWKSKLCIDELNIESLQVNMKEATVTSPDALVEKAINDSNFTLPFSVQLKKFSLGRAQIISQDLVLNFLNFTSALSVNNNVINDLAIALENVKLEKAHVIFSKTQDSSSKPIQNASTAWPFASLPELYSPFKLALSSLVVKTLIVDERDKAGNQNTLITTTENVARLSWFKTHLSIEELSSSLKTIGSLSVKGKVDFLPPYTVDLVLNSAIDNFDLLPQLNDSNQNILLSGNLSDLVTKITSEGELELTAEMLVNITDANLPYKFSADVTKFTLPDDIAQLITPSTLSLKSQGDLTQHVIDLNSKISGFGYHNALLVLKATYDEQTIKINTLNFEDVNAINMLDIEGELQLGSRLFWDIKVKSTGFTLPNLHKDLSGRVQGNIHSKGFWFGKEWAFTLVDSAVKGEINNISLNAEANIDINHKFELADSNISLDYGDIALNLNGYSDENWHVNGKVNIKNTELWLKSVESELLSNISISGALQQPEVSLKGELRKLLLANISSDAIKFDVNYSPMNNHKHEVAFSSERVNWNDYNVHSINVTSLGDLNQQSLKVAWLGDSSIDLLINSNYSPQKDQLNVLTNKINFSLGEHVFKSNQPLHLRYKNTQKSVSINKHCWIGTETELCLNEETNLQLEKGKVTLAIKVGTDILTPFLPDNILLNSSLVGNVAVGWQPEKLPSVDANLLIGDGQLQIKKEGRLHPFLEWQNGQLNVKLNNNNVSGNMALFSQLSTEIVNLSSSVSLVGNRVIESKLTINDFNISPLQAYVPELNSLEGLLNTHLTVVGDLDKPIINGEMLLTKGKAIIIGNINTFEDINMSLAFNGQQAVVSGGLNVNRAIASLKGNIDWQEELKGNFDFDGESLNFSLPPDLNITVSPHINATINASELRISGRIEVLEGKLTVDKLPQGSISLSKDVIIVNDEGQQIANEKPFNVFTNVRVVIADTFKVEGQGFIGRLGGELQVNQQANQPLQLFGSLKIPEGRYRAYGQNLSVTKGTISFNGTANNPYVAIQATRSIDKENIVVGIDATGLANSMNIKLFSKPTMQQSETLSYLVRGRGLDAETSDSNMAIGVALGSAITNFSGVLTQIEKLPLINRIEIDGDDKQASIAGYLGDQVYIKYGIGIIEPINELTVRFYLLSRLWVETVSGLENSADLYYSFDIK